MTLKKYHKNALIMLIGCMVLCSTFLNSKERFVSLDDFIYIFRILDQESDPIKKLGSDTLMYYTCITSKEKELIRSILLELEFGEGFIMGKYLLDCLQQSSFVKLCYGNSKMYWDTMDREWMVITRQDGKDNQVVYAGKDFKKAMKVLRR